MEQPSLRHHPAVQAFVLAAQRYCALVESPPADRDQWLADLLHAIASLYAAAPAVRNLGLPEKTPTTADIPADLRITNDHWQILYDYLRRTLPVPVGYSAHFRPADAQPADEPTTGDLADDLADIYRDLKPGLLAFNLPGDDYLEDILFQWTHHGHIHHWGRHAVDAIRALHWHVYK